MIIAAPTTEQQMAIVRLEHIKDFEAFLAWIGAVRTEVQDQWERNGDDGVGRGICQFATEISKQCAGARNALDSARAAAAAPNKFIP